MEPARAGQCFRHRRLIDADDGDQRMHDHVPTRATAGASCSSSAPNVTRAASGLQCTRYQRGSGPSASRSKIALNRRRTRLRTHRIADFLRDDDADFRSSHRDRGRAA